MCNNIDVLLGYESYDPNIGRHSTAAARLSSPTTTRTLSKRNRQPQVGGTPTHTPPADTLAASTTTTTPSTFASVSYRRDALTITHANTAGATSGVSAQLGTSPTNRSRTTPTGWTCSRSATFGQQGKIDNVEATTIPGPTSIRPLAPTASRSVGPPH